MSEESPFTDPFADETSGVSHPGGSTADAFDEGGEDIEVHAPSSTSSSSSKPRADESDPFASVDQSSAPGPSFDSFSHLEENKEEETPLAQWEFDRKIVLAERQQKADDAKNELLSRAKEDLAKFYADQKAKIEKTQKTNRADEKNYKQDMKQLFETGSRWEKVNKLVNTQPKAAEKPGTSRVDRYRKLLIQLKAVKDKEEKKSI